jgi:hypothetical protein
VFDHPAIFAGVVAIVAVAYMAGVVQGARSRDMIISSQLEMTGHLYGGTIVADIPAR